MDGEQFDDLSRSVGEETSRRGMIRAAAGGALGLLGIGVVAEEALAKKGYDGDKCKKNKDCLKGLKCKGDKNNNKNKKGRCRYKDGCGKKDDACKKNDDCCGSRKCRNRKCRAKN
ncbi:MAG: hypothetical protein U0031_21515 [Thermomicrobiales bacterium]